MKTENRDCLKRLMSNSFFGFLPIFPLSLFLLEHSSWLIDYTFWTILFGLHFLDYTFWTTLSGLHFLDYTFWNTLSGLHFLVYTFWYTLSGLHFLDYAFWIVLYSVSHRELEHVTLLDYVLAISFGLFFLNYSFWPS